MTPAAALVMSDGQREALHALSRSQTAPHRQVQRARALLLAADGVANVRIAAEVGVKPATVRAWRARFAEEGLAKLGKVRAGRGRKSTIAQEKIDEIVHLTRYSTPDGQTHWSCRTMAAKAGVSAATVQRVWAARGLKPHLVDTFKLSNDPKFEEKLIDVVGLYLNPPEKAIVLCMDEKSSVQALDRTEPSLPIKQGRAQTILPVGIFDRCGLGDHLVGRQLPNAPACGVCFHVRRHLDAHRRGKPVVRSARRKLAALEAGEPMVIPAWKLGGNSFPEARSIPWVADRSVTNVRVRPDDEVVPLWECRIR